MTQKHKQPMQIERLIRPNQRLNIGQRDMFYSANWITGVNSSFLVGGSTNQTCDVDLSSKLKEGDVIRSLELEFITQIPSNSITFSGMRITRSYVRADGVIDTENVVTLSDFTETETMAYGEGYENRVIFEIPGGRTVEVGDNWYSRIQATTGVNTLVAMHNAILTVDQS